MLAAIGSNKHSVIMGVVEVHINQRRLGRVPASSYRGKGSERGRKPQKLGMAVTQHNAMNASNLMRVSPSSIRDWRGPIL